jgi:hypothetical protein
MSGNTSNVSLDKMLKQVFRVLLSEELHTCLPGKIEKYDSATRKATITPLLKKKYLDGSTLDLQPIPGVPVTFLGVGNSGLRLPEEEYIGQNVILVFSERSIDNWVLNGKLSEPGNTNKFDLTDAIAICFINDFSKVDEGGNNLVLHYNNNTISIKNNGDIEIDGGNKIIVKANGDIELGTTGLKKLITQDIITAMTVHTHSGVTAGGGVTGPPTYVPPLSVALHATQKVSGQ